MTLTSMNYSDQDDDDAPPSPRHVQTHSDMSRHVQTFRQNVDVETASKGSNVEKQENSLIERIATIKLRDSVGESTTDDFTADVGLADSCIAKLEARNGYLQTDRKAPNHIECGGFVLPPVVLVTQNSEKPTHDGEGKTNDCDVNAQRLGSSELEAGRSNDTASAVETYSDNHRAQNTERNLVEKVQTVTLVDDKAANDVSRQTLEKDGQTVVGQIGMTPHGPTNGCPSLQHPNGGQPVKFIRCSPKTADSASVPHLSNKEAYFPNVNQPPLECPHQNFTGYPPVYSARNEGVMVNGYPWNVGGTFWGQPFHTANGGFNSTLSQYLPGPPASTIYHLPSGLVHRTGVPSQCSPTERSNVGGQNSFFSRDHPSVVFKWPISIQDLPQPTAVSQPTPTAPQSSTNLVLDPFPDLSLEDVERLAPVAPGYCTEVNYESIIRDVTQNAPITQTSVLQQPALTSTCNNDVIEHVHVRPSCRFATSTAPASMPDAQRTGPAIALPMSSPNNHIQRQFSSNATLSSPVISQVEDSPGSHESVVVAESPASCMSSRRTSSLISLPASASSPYESCSPSSCSQPPSVTIAYGPASVYSDSTSNSVQFNGSPVTVDPQENSEEIIPSQGFRFDSPPLDLADEYNLDDLISKIVTPVDAPDNEEQRSRALKRASQLNQSDLLCQNSDGDSYVFINAISD